jgi:hypothetical protein
MADVNVFGLIASILGSSAITVIVKQLLDKRKLQAETVKLKRESDEIVLEGTFKVTEFYKRELDDIIKKYKELEKKFDDEIRAHSVCMDRLDKLEEQYNSLKKQVDTGKSE